MEAGAEGVDVRFFFQRYLTIAPSVVGRIGGR